MSAPNFLRLTFHHAGPALVNINTVRSISQNPTGRGTRLTYFSGDRVIVDEAFEDVVDLITSMSLGRFTRLSSVDPS